MTIDLNDKHGKVRTVKSLPPRYKTEDFDDAQHLAQTTSCELDMKLLPNQAAAMPLDTEQLHASIVSKNILYIALVYQTLNVLNIH